eukprot:SAG22_NODE_8610_length_641_cov_1.426199_1_plen_55_part_00
MLLRPVLFAHSCLLACLRITRRHQDTVLPTLAFALSYEAEELAEVCIGASAVHT